MASFDENGKYIKTNWKAGDKITATKLNKIEESIEAVNDNDISRHVEADARLDALEAKDAAQDKELTNIKKTIADNKAAAELGDYEINSRMQFLEDDVEQAVSDMNNAVITIRNEMNAHTNTVNTNVDNKISAFETEFDAEVAGLKAVNAEIQNDVSEIQDDVSEIQDDVSEIQDDVSEIQNDITNAHTQSFTVNDSYKFTLNHDEMMTSLVTLNNIEGLSSIETNNANQKFLVNNIIHDICTIDVGSTNYFDYVTSTEIMGNALYDIINKSITITGDNSQGWSGVTFNLDNLTEGKRYCLFCDSVTVKSGGSGIEIIGGEMNSLPACYLTNFPRQSANNVVFTAGANTIGVNLFCSAISGNAVTQGSVTYENIQIYEVKDIIVPDIQLNSLPNGVKDEIKDGVLIKRTGYIPLNTLSWKESSTNVDYPNSPFKVYSAPLDNLKLHVGDDKIILCNMLECKSQREHTASAADTGSTAISGSPERAEVRIKVSRTGAPDLTSLYAWLANDNVHMVYELAGPEYIDVSTAIKADKNDTIIVNTCKPLDFTYDIQCSTKSQIEETQKQIAKSNKSIWEKLKEVTEKIKNLTDVKMKLENNGYIKLPTAFGGLTLQWGLECITADGVARDANKVVNYPIAFTQRVFFHHSNCYNSSWLTTNCTSESLTSIRLCVVNIDANPLPQTDFWLTWFAIGI